jgi:hypothetical protein
MQKLSCFVVAASAAALLLLPAGAALAQGAPGSDTAPAATSPAAPEPPKAPEPKAAEPRAPENKAAENPAPEKAKAASKKKKPTRMTRQQEIDRSIDRGTVPARYRNSVPKEYHQYIPFDKQ